MIAGFCYTRYWRHHGKTGWTVRKRKERIEWKTEITREKGLYHIYNQMMICVSCYFDEFFNCIVTTRLVVEGKPIYMKHTGMIFFNFKINYNYYVHLTQSVMWAFCHVVIVRKLFNKSSLTLLGEKEKLKRYNALNDVWKAEKLLFITANHSSI